jgi:hypothetical protein
MNFLCLIGIHRWQYKKRSRVCCKCKLVEDEIYDMSYGGIYYARP